MKLQPIETGTYLVAVSGGVDSMVLIELLRAQPHLNVAIAHVNHGIRPDSARDEDFVRSYAKTSGITYYSKKLKLGPKASEATARRARHAFFKELIKKHGYDGLITAHHHDDIVETAIINMIRGTGWRGLVAMQSNKNILRPLAECTKQEIIDYAQENNIFWVEDSTNVDTKYLRNYIRHNVLKDDEQTKEKLKIIIEKQEQTEAEIRQLLAVVKKQVVLKKNPLILSRYQCIMLPNDILAEVLREVLDTLDPRPPINKKRIQAMVQFIKTAQANKVLQLGGPWHMRSSPRKITFIKNS